VFCLVVTVLVLSDAVTLPLLVYISSYHDRPLVGSIIFVDENFRSDKSIQGVGRDI